MKTKQLIGIGLSTVMLASSVMTMAGCSNTGNVAATSSVKPITLTLCMVTEEETNKAGIQAVQDAINDITENDLSVHIELKLYTEDEYKDKIEDMLYARAQDEANGIKYSSIGNSEDIQQVEIIEGLYREVTAYPDPYANQIDIFLLPDYESFQTYLAEGMLSDVTESLTNEDGVAVKLNKYLSSALLTYGQDFETQYAIPSNNIYGDYEYLLIKKDLFDQYTYSISDVSDLADLTDYLSDVAADYEDLIPLYNVTDMGVISLTGENSVVGAYIPNGALESDSYAPGNILSNSNVKSYLSSILTFASVNGNYPVRSDEIDFNANFAAAILVGDAKAYEEYEDEYYVVKTRNPVAEADEVTNAMFAVSAYTSDASRCMEVINYINTNAELLNTILYGVENVTYTRDESTGIVSRRHATGEADESVYIMSEYKVGNLFLAYQNDEMSEEVLKLSANDWELAKMASTDVTYSPYIKVQMPWDTVADHEGEENFTLLEEYSEQLAVLYDEMWVKIYEYGTAVDANTGEHAAPSAYIDSLQTWLANDDAVKAMVDTKDENSLRNIYLTWYQAIYAE